MNAAGAIEVELGADDWNPSGWIASGAVGVGGFAIGSDFYFQGHQSIVSRTTPHWRSLTFDDAKEAGFKLGKGLTGKKLLYLHRFR